MSNKVTFNGISREIVVSSGVTEVDVAIDLYSEWKRWSVTENNLKFIQAFRTFGGDPTISGQFAPSYFFLMNNWKVIVDYGNVSFGVNLYSEDGSSPFIVGVGASVTNRNSDAVIVDNGISENLDFGGVVHINSIIGTTGTNYPVGTVASPVNNIGDAITIATNRNIQEFHIYGEVLINQNLNDFIVFGGNLRDVINIDNVNVSGTTFKQCLIYGNGFGDCALDNCILLDVYGISGFFQNCGFKGSIGLSDNTEVTMVNCFSQIPGNNSPSLYLGNDISLSLRNYSGGLGIYDCKTGTTVTLEYNAGNCKILSGNTGGEIVVRGIAKFTDQSSGTTIETNGLIIPYNVASQHSLNVNTEITRNK